jgi:hypothetical protein
MSGSAVYSFLGTGGWPTFSFDCWHDHDRGCPTFRGFRKVGTTDLGFFFLRQVQPPGVRLEHEASSAKPLVPPWHPLELPVGQPPPADLVSGFSLLARERWK